MVSVEAAHCWEFYNTLVFGYDAGHFQEPILEFREEGGRAGLQSTLVCALELLFPSLLAILCDLVQDFLSPKGHI